MTSRTDTSPRPAGKGVRHQSVVGLRFRMLVVETQSVVNGRSMARCRCDCGGESTIRVSRLYAGQEGCGCQKGRHSCPGGKAIKHGHAADRRSTPTYSSWRSMMSRCSNPNDPTWENYGGRGIVVCERWNLFDNFLADMSERPSLSVSLDRIDNGGNYEPGNCRWADAKTQNRNTRWNRFLTHNGKTATVAEWVERSGLNYGTFWRRLRRGWDMETILNTPNLGRGGRP